MRAIDSAFCGLVCAGVSWGWATFADVSEDAPFLGQWYAAASSLIGLAAICLVFIAMSNIPKANESETESQTEES